MKKSNRYRILLVVLGILGIVIGLNVPFDKLINVVYVINGWVGFMLLFLMIYTDIRVRLLKNYTPKIVLELNDKKK